MNPLERLAWLIGYKLSWRLLRRLLEPRAYAGKPRVEKAAIYIHIPFCASPCRFCCFVKYSVPEDAPPPRWYFRVLLREVEWAADVVNHATHVHIGGGTPSLYPELLAELVDALREYFNRFTLTIEVHPSDVIDDEKFEVLKRLGVDRWSIGVQSFNDNMLRVLGRLRHNGREAEEAVSRLSRLNATLNVDLVFGIPGQSVETHISDVKRAVELGATQVTLYPLLITGWYRHPEMYRMYAESVKLFKSLGWRMDTPWTFSRGVQHREYIVDSLEYIGLGVSSISLVGRNVFVNTFSLSRYPKLVEKNGWSVATYTRLSRLEKRLYNSLVTLEVRVAGLWRRLGTRVARIAYLIGESRRGMYSALARYRRLVLQKRLL